MAPILKCYVDDQTLARLNEYARQDGQGRDAVRLAEDAIADAAIRAAPPANKLASPHHQEKP